MANGEAEIPLGWVNVPITLHDKVFNIPAVILLAKALAYAVVLGLDFIFFNGLQINVADQKYFFKSHPNEKYPFQPGNASIPIVNSKLPNEKMEDASLSLISVVSPPQPIAFQSPDHADKNT